MQGPPASSYPDYCSGNICAASTAAFWASNLSREIPRHSRIKVEQGSANCLGAATVAASDESDSFGTSVV